MYACFVKQYINILVLILLSIFSVLETHGHS